MTTTRSVRHVFTSDAAPGEASGVRALDRRWASPVVGGGRLTLTETGLRLSLERVADRHYSNAQFDDYTGKRICLNAGEYVAELGPERSFDNEAESYKLAGNCL